MDLFRPQSVDAGAFQFPFERDQKYGSGWITLGAKLRNDWLELFVTDTGRGYPAGESPAYFRPFRKAERFCAGDGAGAFHLPEHRRATRRTDRVRSQVGEGVRLRFVCLAVRPRPYARMQEGSADRRRKSDSGRRGCETNFKLLEAALSKNTCFGGCRTGRRRCSASCADVPT